MFLHLLYTLRTVFRHLFIYLFILIATVFFTGEQVCGDPHTAILDVVFCHFKIVRYSKCQAISPVLEFSQVSIFLKILYHVIIKGGLMLFDSLKFKRECFLI